MPRRPIRDLELADLTEDLLRDLIAEGETDLVERKVKVPDDGLGPTVASFANSGGGWVLLGIDNNGVAVGFTAPGRAEPQDWLRTALRKDIDPLPPFAARAMSVDGRDIIVIRVQASPLTPHMFKPNGAIYIREHGGRHPIGSQAALLALAVRPEQAKADAYFRMTSLPLVKQALGEHDLGAAVNEQTRVADWIVTAGPLVVPDGFRTRALSRPVVATMRDLTVQQLHELGPPNQGTVRVHPHGSGVLIEGRNLATGNEAHLLLDAGGVAVGRIRMRLTRGICYVPTTADDILTPLLTLTLGALSECGVVGTTHLHLHVRITPTADGWEPVLSLGTANSSGELRAPPGQEAFLGEDIDVPAEQQDAKSVAEVWMRELARMAGIDWWEPESA